MSTSALEAPKLKPANGSAPQSDDGAVTPPLAEVGAGPPLAPQDVALDQAPPTQEQLPQHTPAAEEEEEVTRCFDWSLGIPGVLHLLHNATKGGSSRSP